jgi:hypothetical protein
LTSELCPTIGDKLLFTWHIIFEVGKTQDLSSKIWQTLGDTLRRLLWGQWDRNHLCHRNLYHILMADAKLLKLGETRTTRHLVPAAIQHPCQPYMIY